MLIKRIMGYKMCLLGLLLLFAFMAITFGEMRFGKYKRIYGRFFPENETLKTVTLRHLTKCVSHCDDVTDCRSVSWNGATGSCQLSHHDIIHERHVKKFMSASSAWTAVVKMRYKVFNMQGPTRYSLTFSDAVKKCHDNGYVLADPADMIEARDAGFQECSCGWTSDGTSHVMIQYYDQECWYTYTDGYERCYDGYLFDVWCKLI